MSAWRIVPGRDFLDRLEVITTPSPGNDHGSEQDKEHWFSFLLGLIGRLVGLFEDVRLAGIELAMNAFDDPVARSHPMRPFKG